MTEGHDRLALISLAVTPKTRADAERLAQGLQALRSEDPALRFDTGDETGETVIGASSELHLEIVVDRLKREFNVEAALGRPRVAFKETLTRPADGEMKYVSQADGRGQYGHVKLRLHPAEPGSGCILENRLTGGAIPARFIESVSEGIRDTLAHGVVAGYPIDDVRIELHDGSYHDVDSTPAAFRIAGTLAAWVAVRKAKPVLLEPVMRVDVVAPTEHVGDVLTNLIRRRGQIQSRQDLDGTQAVRASVPLAGLFGYATDLRGLTRGRGVYTMRFEEYRPFRADEGSSDEDRDSIVGAPLRPAPTLRASGVALPEPDEDWAED
jgi:elongation factor G